MTRTKHVLPHLSKLPHPPDGGHLATTNDLTCIPIPYKVDLQWNRVSNPDPSVPEDEILPPGLRDPLRGLFWYPRLGSVVNVRNPTGKIPVNLEPIAERKEIETHIRISFTILRSLTQIIPYCERL
ncbi:hypothetical protein AVEN_42383-1 [Araneus ventricosus]|uniref:Uncharacterized protein n=1 Tax=Araneus ventricosus TaxID=182803 RepID=A0A4Y2BIN6_ARAVE|nr:hypothetical protein AVEN_42383-1 [Araneus ventricosus]